MVFQKTRHFLPLFLENWMVKTLRRGILLKAWLLLAKFSFSLLFKKFINCLAFFFAANCMVKILRRGILVEMLLVLTKLNSF